LVLIGEHKAVGGKLIKVCLTLDEEGKISQAMFSGDFFVDPPDLLVELSDAIRGVKPEDVDQVEERVRRVIEGRGVAYGVSARDFAEAVAKARVTNEAP